MIEDVAGNYLFAVTPSEEDTARALVVRHHEALMKRKAQTTSAKQRVFADLTHERSLLERGARLVAGMDEVGRGALAGPVVVGVCVIDTTTIDPPPGLTDSKDLSPDVRKSIKIDQIKQKMSCNEFERKYNKCQYN